MNSVKVLRSTIAKSRGVTLLELVIVVAIIGIIAAFAYPSYTDYVREARRTDGHSTLLKTAQRYERCLTATGRYDDAANPGNPGCGIPAAINSDEGFYVVTATALNATTFTLTATLQAAGAGDPCGNLTLDQAGVKGQSGTGDCW